MKSVGFICFTKICWKCNTFGGNLELAMENAMDDRSWIASKAIYNFFNQGQELCKNRKAQLNVSSELKSSSFYQPNFEKVSGWLAVAFGKCRRIGNSFVTGSEAKRFQISELEEASQRPKRINLNMEYLEWSTHWWLYLSIDWLLIEAAISFFSAAKQ